MIICRKDCSRLLVLALALLLSAPMNPLCVAVDADNDDGTPPVTIELSLLAAGQESLDHAQLGQHSAEVTESSAAMSLSSSLPMKNPELKEVAVCFSIPLRC